MTDDTEKPGSPEVWMRAGLAGAFLFLYLSIVLICFVLPFRRYPAVFQQLGMTELPWVTQMFVSLIEAMHSWWWAIGAVFLGLAFLAWKGRLGQRSFRPVAVIFLVAALLPGLGYLAMEMPIVELQKKLQGGS